MIRLAKRMRLKKLRKFPWIGAKAADPLILEAALPATTVNNFIDGALMARSAHRIIPLGSFCIVSSIMKRFGIKRTSMPFDWLFCRPEVVLACLNDDFAQFLNPDHYRSYTAELGRRCCAHLLYDPSPLAEQMFNHRDPTDAQDYAYIQRCVERFRAALREGNDKLFVMMNNRGQLSSGLFLQISGRLREISSKSHFIAIDVGHELGVEGCQTMQILTADGSHRLYRQHPVLQSTGVHFPYDLDNLVILSTIQGALRPFA